MKNFIIFLSILFSGSAFSCSCSYDRTMEEVFSKSSTVFYGEIVGVKKLGAFVGSGKEQEYEVTIHPQKIYKGKSKDKYHFNGFAIYNDIDADEITEGGCAQDMTLGLKFIIMIESGHKNIWGWCEQHIIPTETKAYDHFIKNVSSWL